MGSKTSFQHIFPFGRSSRTSQADPVEQASFSIGSASGIAQSKKIEVEFKKARFGRKRRFRLTNPIV